MLTWKEFVALVTAKLAEEGKDDALIDYFDLYGANGEPVLNVSREDGKIVISAY